MEAGTAGRRWTLEVTDLKQWAHCPRVVYYHYVLPRIRPVTALMREGQAHHQAGQGLTSDMAVPACAAQPRCNRRYHRLGQTFTRLVQQFEAR